MKKMRQLNKVIFINSATISYQEVLVDGNVHFIGTQGVGKSTILRAILFFYNADSLKLGIPQGKKPFAEYYFSYTNSFIVYEVASETGAFCILAYKQSGRIAYRFIDSAYNAEHFVFENKALEGWDKIRMKLDAVGIDYSSKIERHEEYRNILYGNSEGNSKYKKYALLESKLYQNIPRTIQNVFLNAKLDADFIKKTIIDSLMEETVPIDLGVYKHHLQEFENEYKDIETFKNKKVFEKAERIIENHNHILKSLHDKVENRILLDKAVVLAENKKPLLVKNIEKSSEDLGLIQTKLKELDKLHSDNVAKINEEKGEWTGKLQSAKEKQKKYAAIDILSIKERVEKEEEQKSKSQKLIQEQATITSEFKDIENKYKTLFDQLENERREFENIQAEKKGKLKENHSQMRESIMASAEKLQAEINQQFKGKIIAADITIKAAQEHFHDLDKKQAVLKSTRFKEDEIILIKHALIQNEKDYSAAESSSKLETANRNLILKELEGTIANIESTYKQSQNKLLESQNQKQAELGRLIDWISKSNGALFGFLNQNYPGWEETIGKVINEEILFDTELSPEFIESTATLYGLKINLHDLKTKIKTLEGYNKEKELLEKELLDIRMQLEQLEEIKVTDLEKAKRRFQPKIREHSDSLQKLEYSLKLLTSKLTSLKLDLSEAEKKAQIEKTEALTAIKNQLVEAKNKWDFGIEERKNIGLDLESHIAKVKIERDDKVAGIVVELNKAIVEIEHIIKTKRKEIEERTLAFNEAKHKELHGKGLDTGRLREIEKQIKSVTDEISYIEKNRKTVYEFQFDSENYIDKIDFFNSNVLLKDEELKQVAELNQKMKSELLSEYELINNRLSLLRKEFEVLEGQLKTYEEFKNTKEYESEFSDRLNHSENLSLLTITEYISKIKEAYYSYIEKYNALTALINDYSGRFSVNNIFSFRTGLVASAEYLNFAQTLREFIDENKISEFEKRVNKRYAEIINFIDKEVTELISKEGLIQQVISKINKDFIDKNFVGAISVIEMKIEDSASKIIGVLKRIKSFNADGQFNTFSGAPNLFSTDVDEKRINEAVSLLATLVREIKDSRNNSVFVADSFELKFRVVENQNDSGWVEKLSNIGSEGTDILVKAMINIMLLNVFKDSASRKLKDFKLHCMMDEIGRLHPSNVRGILKFASERNIFLINGSPIEHDALAYKHIYELRKDNEKNTRVRRLISTKNEVATARS